MAGAASNRTPRSRRVIANEAEKPAGSTSLTGSFSEALRQATAETGAGNDEPIVIPTSESTSSADSSSADDRAEETLEVAPEAIADDAATTAAPVKKATTKRAAAKKTAAKKTAAKKTAANNTPGKTATKKTTAKKTVAKKAAAKKTVTTAGSASAFATVASASVPAEDDLTVVDEQTSTAMSAADQTTTRAPAAMSETVVDVTADDTVVDDLTHTVAPAHVLDLNTIADQARAAETLAARQSRLTDRAERAYAHWPEDPTPQGLPGALPNDDAVPQPTTAAALLEQLEAQMDNAAPRSRKTWPVAAGIGLIVGLAIGTAVGGALQTGEQSNAPTTMLITPSNAVRDTTTTTEVVTTTSTTEIVLPTTEAPTTAPPETTAPTTAAPARANSAPVPTTSAPTTEAPTTLPPETVAPTTTEAPKDPVQQGKTLLSDTALLPR